MVPRPTKTSSALQLEALSAAYADLEKKLQAATAAQGAPAGAGTGGESELQAELEMLEVQEGHLKGEMRHLSSEYIYAQEEVSSSQN